MLQLKFRPLLGVNRRLLVGGGILGMMVIGEAAFAYGANLV
jgi:hypothetical protein